MVKKQSPQPPQSPRKSKLLVATSALLVLGGLLSILATLLLLGSSGVGSGAILASLMIAIGGGVQFAGGVFGLKGDLRNAVRCAWIMLVISVFGFFSIIISAVQTGIGSASIVSACSQMVLPMAFLIAIFRQNRMNG